MAPKIVDPESRKREIASVAFDLFAELGYESCSIGKVADAAGIGKGTIYEYFRSKEELLLATIRFWFEGMGRESSAGVEDIDDPEKRLRALCIGIVDSLISKPNSMRMNLVFMKILVSSDVDKEPFLALMNEMLASYRRQIAELVLDGVSRGKFRPEIAKNAEIIAFNLAAYMDGICLYQLFLKNQFDLHKQVELALDSMLSGLRSVDRVDGQG